MIFLVNTNNCNSFDTTVVGECFFHSFLFFFFRRAWLTVTISLFFTICLCQSHTRYVIFVNSKSLILQSFIKCSYQFYSITMLRTIHKMLKVRYKAKIGKLLCDHSLAPQTLRCARHFLSKLKTLLLKLKNIFLSEAARPFVYFSFLFLWCWMLVMVPGCLWHNNYRKKWKYWEGHEDALFSWSWWNLWGRDLGVLFPITFCVTSWIRTVYPPTPLLYDQLDSNHIPRRHFYVTSWIRTTYPSTTLLCDRLEPLTFQSIVRLPNHCVKGPRWLK